MLEINLQKMRHKLRFMGNTSAWRKVSFEATGRFEESVLMTCGHCGRPCLGRAGFLSHLRFHRRRVSSAKHEKVSSVHTTRQNSIYRIAIFVTSVAKSAKV